MAGNGRTRAKVAAAAFGVAVLLLILYASMGLSQYTCEVCIEFDRQTKCRSAAGATREEAQRTATDNACAFLASGMTDSIRCSRTPPTSVRCEP